MGLWPSVSWERIESELGNSLCLKWGHYLGSCERPFKNEHWCLFVGGEPVCVAVSSSTVASRTAGVRREECVELSRLCRSPEAKWSTRVALRLWREVSAQLWSCWTVHVAFAYSSNDRHDGRTYRFDGWKRVGRRRGARGGGTWTKKREGGSVAASPKTLWAWGYSPIVLRCGGQ